MFRNALQWRMIPQEYLIQNRILYDLDARKFGALFLTRLPGGFLFKSVAEGGTSIAFVPESEDTHKMVEQLRLNHPPSSDEKRAMEQYERQTFGLQESGAEAQELEEWLVRFHDEVQPNKDERERAALELLTALVKLDGKQGIKAEQNLNTPWAVRLHIANQGQAVVRYEDAEFLLVDTTDTKKKIRRLVYDPVTKRFRGRPTTERQRGSPGVQTVIEAASRLIRRMPDET
jgi:hypothetical protein